MSGLICQLDGDSSAKSPCNKFTPSTRSFLALDAVADEMILSWLTTFEITPWNSPCTNCGGPGACNCVDPNGLNQLFSSALLGVMSLLMVSTGIRSTILKARRGLIDSFFRQVLFLPQALRMKRLLPAYAAAMHDFCREPRSGHTLAALKDLPWCMILQSVKVQTQGSELNLRVHERRLDIQRCLSPIYNPIFYCNSNNNNNNNKLLLLLLLL
ncbi:unnamed protein product [Polarella glacialis]|uniref:Uncharacterized protein n=1 Tax=Polarella glacialis TaxID=89957 RepID=A0A813H770_POLGL|nr:unnamed protein product [Polarella glacialis]